MVSVAAMRSSCLCYAFSSMKAMTSWLLLGLFLVGAHRDSQHFAVQLDAEIEESPPANLAIELLSEKSEY